MKFTYQGYAQLIELLRKNDYQITSYLEKTDHPKQVILRHDVDNSLEKALEFAMFEKSIGVQSTYYILLTSDFYNSASKHSRACIQAIHTNGHDIGLHFDEVAYNTFDAHELVHSVEKEAQIMRDFLGLEIKSVSMHRPSKTTLDSNYSFDTLINSYSQKYFNDYKYLSDSRMHWREDVETIINAQNHKKLHILTHPFWYSKHEKTREEHVRRFITSANEWRYDCMAENIRDLEAIVKRESIR